MENENSFSERLGSLLSDVLESGEIPQEESKPSRDFSKPEEQEKDTKKAIPKNGARIFFRKKENIGKIIRQGNYTAFPPEIVAAFDVLGCAPTVSQKEVRQAFRKKIKHTHPDFSKIQNDTDATENAEKIISANEIIKQWLATQITAQN